MYVGQLIINYKIVRKVLENPPVQSVITLLQKSYLLRIYTKKRIKLNLFYRAKTKSLLYYRPYLTYSHSKFSKENIFVELYYIQRKKRR